MHPSAWKAYSAKFACRIMHSRGPIDPGTPDLAPLCRTGRDRKLRDGWIFPILDKRQARGAVSPGTRRPMALAWSNVRGKDLPKARICTRCTSFVQ
jgi:hypothetical protein